METRFRADESFAHELDQSNPLARFRERFFVPSETIYVDGNSLGLLTKGGEACARRVLEEWKTAAIQGWDKGDRPWIDYAERLGAELAPLVGAKPQEVVCTGTTTINLHALVAAFYHPRVKRTKLLADDLTFPSDIYALRSQVRAKGLDPDTHLLFAPAIEGRYLDEDGIIDMMSDDVVLIVLPSALYRSSQLLNIERLTREAHKRGIPIGWDCSHTIGAMPHAFDEWGVDFAFWCSYKYLNGGPGCPGFLYLNEQHFGREPVLTGWFGYKKEKQFDMLVEFEHAQSAAGWQISTPAVLGMAPMEGALAVMKEAGIDAIREHSLRLTSYLMFLVDELLPPETSGLRLGTPREPQQRGGHVALEHPTDAARIFEALSARGVICDYRLPDVIRMAPIALYNTYHEVWRVVQHLREIVDTS
jgi:kynureninase